MNITKLWPSLILEDVLEIDSNIERLVLKSRSAEFDGNTEFWDINEGTKELKKTIFSLAKQWMKEAMVKDAELTLSNSFVNIDNTLQGVPLRNNHNSEIVALLFITTGLEHGLAVNVNQFNQAESPINTPFGAPVNNNSLVLVDPRGSAVTLEENGFKSFYEITPSVGKIVLFPSYLSYYILSNMGKGHRITLMANFEVE